jgi:hypothetical protein
MVAPMQRFNNAMFGPSTKAKNPARMDEHCFAGTGARTRKRMKRLTGPRLLTPSAKTLAL